jgi:hypothetical protein
MDESNREFESAAEIARRRSVAVPERPFEVEDPAVAEALVVRPVMDLEQAKKVWNAYLALKDFLLRDEACADDIAGSREMNRTGATRLATAFGLSLETIEIREGRVQEADTNEYDYRFLVRVRASRGARFTDGIASCRLSEIPAKTKKGEEVPYSQREHFALTKADTRARKRAIADLLGGTEAE